MKAINIASFQDQLEMRLGTRQTRRRYIYKNLTLIIMLNWSKCYIVKYCCFIKLLLMILVYSQGKK